MKTLKVKHIFKLLLILYIVFGIVFPIFQWGLTLKIIDKDAGISFIGVFVIFSWTISLTIIICFISKLVFNNWDKEIKLK